ncbi:hypothetical protein HY988_04110 [Candidatus Micrarchaeota archaeon]|nr:hypothetical protein [Candidatus Micrarchaeota archaeon]
MRVHQQAVARVTTPNAQSNPRAPLLDKILDPNLLEPQMKSLLASRPRAELVNTLLDLNQIALLSETPGLATYRHHVPFPSKVMVRYARSELTGALWEKEREILDSGMKNFLVIAKGIFQGGTLGFLCGTFIGGIWAVAERNLSNVVVLGIVGILAGIASAVDYQLKSKRSLLRGIQSHWTSNIGTFLAVHRDRLLKGKEIPESVVDSFPSTIALARD